MLKTLTAADYRKYSGGWRAHKLRMQNHLTGKLSILSWSNYRFGNGLGGAQFSVNALKSLR